MPLIRAWLPVSEDDQMTITATPSPETSHGRAPRSRVRLVALVIVALLAAAIGRGIVVDGRDSAFVRWLPWLDRTSVTLFFTDASGQRLVPVSRTVSQEQAMPAELVAALLAGPDPGSGLTNPLPPGTTVESVVLSNGTLTVDLGGAFDAAAPFLAQEAVLQSMRSWPGVTAAILTTDGTPLDTNTSGHLLYFYDEALDMLVAQPTNLIRPGDVIDAWLQGPSDADLMGLPPDISAIGVELGSNELLTLELTFTDSLREFAVDHPESVRRVLEGLIATFNTGFPDVGAVLLDFEGQNALGLGQCANLLNTAQTMPDVLNDERLLARYAGS